MKRPEIVPTALTHRAKHFIATNELTEEALAKVFGVKLKELQEGINGAPTVALAIGISKATGWDLREVAYMGITTRYDRGSRRKETAA